MSLTIDDIKNDFADFQAEFLTGAKVDCTIGATDFTAHKGTVERLGELRDEGNFNEYSFSLWTTDDIAGETIEADATLITVDGDRFLIDKYIPMSGNAISRIDVVAVGGF